MAHMLRQMCWIANRLVAGVLIAATAGSVVVLGLALMQEATHRDANVSLLADAVGLAGTAVIGGLFGGALGGLCAFLVLISMLKHVSPWSVFVPLTIGASCGLGIDIFVTGRFLPEGYSGAQSIAALALSCAGASVGGLAASLMVRTRLR